MDFTELPLFERHIYDYLDEDEYSALQWYLAQNPYSGNLIRDGGGIRKLRWGAKDKGKRGGIRVIYYYYAKNYEISLMLVYAKNEVDNISKATLKYLRKELPK